MLLSLLTLTLNVKIRRKIMTMKFRKRNIKTGEKERETARNEEKE